VFGFKIITEEEFNNIKAYQKIILWHMLTFQVV
jgi:hypothetical protein